MAVETGRVTIDPGERGHEDGNVKAADAVASLRTELAPASAE
jgi:hypothetical protein